MEIRKFNNSIDSNYSNYSITIMTSAEDSVGVSTFSFPSGSTEISLVGITSKQIAELVYILEETYQEIVMNDELNLDKLQSGIMEAKQVEQEVTNDR